MILKSHVRKSVTLLIIEVTMKMIWLISCSAEESALPEKIFTCQKCNFTDTLLLISRTNGYRCCGLVCYGVTRENFLLGDTIHFLYSNDTDLMTKLAEKYNIKLSYKKMRGVMLFVARMPGSTEELDFKVHNFTYKGKTSEFEQYINTLFPSIHFMISRPISVPAQLDIAIPGDASFYEILVELGNRLMASWRLDKITFETNQKFPIPGGAQCIWQVISSEHCSAPADGARITWEDWE